MYMITITATVRMCVLYLKIISLIFPVGTITYRVQNVIFAQGVRLSRYVRDRMIPDEIFFPTFGIMYVKYDMSIGIRYKRLCIKCYSGGEKLGAS